MKHLPTLLLTLLLFLTTQVRADQLETSFFQLSVPQDWKTGRSATGFWTLHRESPFPLDVAFVVNRLKTAPDVYLQGTLELWKTQGTIEFVRHQNSLECLITPATGNTVWKWVRWENDLLIVASFSFSPEHRDEALNTAHQLVDHLELRDPSFQEDALRAVVLRGMESHQNSTEELADIEQVRRDMTSFRQDWIAFFTATPPELFTAYLAYLEARYDASFVQVNGESMGMPSSVLEARKKSIENRKREVRSLLQASP